MVKKAKARSPKKSSKKKSPPSNKKRLLAPLQKRLFSYMDATPHRTFRLTRRRDIPKPVKLPGYIAFTRKTLQVIHTHRMPLIKLVLVAWVASLLVVGVAQQSRYADIRDALQAAGEELMGGKVGGAMEVGTVFLSVATGTLNSSLSESQQIYFGLLSILTWLTVIWLLRHLLAGNQVNVRDGIYNAGAPLVSIFIIVSVGILQLLPGALGVMVLNLAQQSGLLVSGIEVGAFSIAALLLVVLSLYWVVSTFFAVIIATIPGTYPWVALRNARQLVVGQRRQILFRLLWLLAILLLIFAAVLMPAIAIDSWLKLSSYPFITIIVQFISTILLVVASTYIYLLYREIIDARD